MQAPTNFDLNAGPRMIARNAEIVQQAMQTGIEIAMRMTEFSAANIDLFVKTVSFQHEVVRSSLLVFAMYADRMREASILMTEELTQSSEQRELIDEEQMRRAA